MEPKPKMAWRVWWRDKPGGKVESQIVTGTIIDAVNVENSHADAHETGRFTVKAPDDE